VREGQKVGDYTLVARIVAGGMGKTWLAARPGLEKKVRLRNRGELERLPAVVARSEAPPNPLAAPTPAAASKQRHAATLPYSSAACCAHDARAVAVADARPQLDASGRGFISYSYLCKRADTQAPRP